MNYIINWAGQNSGLAAVIAIVILTSLIQVSPIKLNPWTYLKLFFLAPIKTEEHLNKIDNDIEGLKADFDKDKAIEARIRILSFGESLIRKGQSTKERFDQIMDDIDTYEQYCIDHPEFKNNRTVQTKEYIKEKYHAGLTGEEEFLQMVKK